MRFGSRQAHSSPKEAILKGEVITQVELENVAENVTMDTSVGDAKQHQPDVVMLKQIQLPDFDDNCTEWIASIDQLDTAVHLNTNLTYSQRIVNLKYCLSGPPVETNDEPIINCHQLSEGKKSN